MLMRFIIGVLGHITNSDKKDNSDNLTIFAIKRDIIGISGT